VFDFCEQGDFLFLKAFCGFISDSFMQFKLVLFWFIFTFGIEEYI